MTDDPPDAALPRLPRLPGPVGTPARRTYPRDTLPSDADRPPTRCPPVIIAEALDEPGLGVWVLVPEESDNRICSYAYAGGIV